MGKGSSGASIIIDKENQIVTKSVPIKNWNLFNHLKNQYNFMKFLNYNELTTDVYNDFFNDNKYFYSMKYEEDTENINADDLLFISEKISSLNYPVPDVSFASYIERLKDHIRFLRKDETFKEMLSYKEFIINDDIVVPNINLIEMLDFGMKYYIHKKPTLCHGDLTRENVVNNYVIDPNLLMDGWNHWLLDYGKVLQSYHYNYEATFSCNSIIINKNKMKCSIGSNILCSFCEDAYYFEATHYLRMLKYKLAESKHNFKIAYIRLCQVWEFFKEIY